MRDFCRGGMQARMRARDPLLTLTWSELNEPIRVCFRP